MLNRLSRIIGHLESVKRMVNEGRDCSEVLVQLAAVDSAVKGVSRVVMKDHIEHCLVEAVKTNDHETLEKLNTAIDRFIK
ncbi:MAG: metal-sensing transcriptional repressor [Veillonella sp.]|nr:metal-sensing transcriptional repressor [Veillonella sp.]